MALKTTAGVYTLANLVMKFSDLDFLELASSTSSMILATVESLNSLVVLIFRTPPVLTQPLITESPAHTS